MTSREFIRQIYQRKLGRLDALSKSNDFTNGENSKIKMLIDEIDECCELTNNWFRYTIEFRIHHTIESRTFDLFEDDIKPTCIELKKRGFNDSMIKEIDERICDFLSNPSNKDFFEDKNLDYIKLFFPDLLKPLYQLKTDLLSFLDSQNETPSTEKKQAKAVWGLAARYNFIKDLEVIKRIELISNQTEIAKAISQILGCSFDNAKKLKNGSYQVDETMEEQLERKQLFQLIEQHQVNKKG